MSRTWLALSIASTLSIAVSSPSEAQTSPFYLQFDGGAAFLGENESVGVDIEYAPGWTVGGRFGVHAGGPLRIEGDVSYIAAEVDELDGIDLDDLDADADVSALNVGLGVYVDVLQAGVVSPYLGAGAAVAFKELDTNFVGDDEETDLSIHGEAGIAVELTPHVALVPHYRFVWFDEVFDDEQFAHLVRLGVRIMP